MQCQHCKDDQNFTIHAAPSLAHGAIEHQRRGCLHRSRSSRASTMMKISPSTQRFALRLQLPNTNAGACCLDTAAPNPDDEAVCFPSPAQRGEGGAQRRMRGAFRTAQTSRAWRLIVNTRIDDIDGLRLRTQQQKRCGSERFRQRIETLIQQIDAGQATRPAEIRSGKWTRPLFLRKATHGPLTGIGE